jgi:hypothetical protein
MTIVACRTNLTRAINILLDINGHLKLQACMILVKKKQKNFCITKSNIKIYQNICSRHKNKSLCMDSCPHCKHVPLFFYIFVGITIYSFGFVRLSAILGLFTLSTNKKTRLFEKRSIQHLPRLSKNERPKR